MATALLGTEQRKCSVVSPEIEFLAAREGVSAEANHEAWVLLASAYAASYRRAGQMPPTEPRAHSFTAVAAVETHPYCSAPVAARLTALLGNLPLMDLFLEELLAAIARKAQIVPPILLPELLNWGQRSKQHRRWLVPVVGERGQWLTTLNAGWKNALQVDPAEKSADAPIISSQQALYDALNITDNIFSKTFSIVKGQGPSSHGRMVQLVTDKVLELSKPGGTHYADQELVKVAVAVPPVVLSELSSHIHNALAQGQTTWLARLDELLELRHQMLRELAHE